MNKTKIPKNGRARKQKIVNSNDQPLIAFSMPKVLIDKHIKAPHISVAQIHPSHVLRIRDKIINWLLVAWRFIIDNQSRFYKSSALYIPQVFMAMFDHFNLFNRPKLKYKNHLAKK